MNTSNHLEILRASFSAVWTATIARKDAFCRDFQNLQDLHSFAPLRPQNLQISRFFFAENFANFDKFLQIFTENQQNFNKNLTKFDEILSSERRKRMQIL